MWVELVKPQWCWLPDGVCSDLCLEISGSTITGIVPSERHPEVWMQPGTLALPGLVNAHSHAFQRAFRGHVQWRPAGRDDFWSWRDRMYATANRLSPEGVEAVSALAFLEMAEAGVTHVGEFHYLQHQADGTRYEEPDLLAQRVIAAAEQVGLRISLLRVAYLRAGPGAALRPDQRRFGDRDVEGVLSAVERLRRTAGPRVTVGLAPHSVRAVDEASLREMAGFDGMVHAHVSEQPAENQLCQEENGCSPLALFERAGLLTGRFTAVHLTWPVDGDVERLVESGAAVCACPSTELDLGDGWLPLSLRHRARVALGTDSQASIDLLGEARTLELHARALAQRRNVLAPDGDRHGLAARLLTAATGEGSRVLSGAAPAGSTGIRVGAEADLVLLDLDRPAADGVPPLEAAAFVAGPDWVRDVWVAGQRIVVDGRHPGRDRIRADARPHLEGGAD